VNGQNNNSMGKIVTDFSKRLLEDWLPSYCNDPKRNYSVEGFKHDSIKVSNQDARDFMRAIDTKIVTDVGGGRFRMPQSKASEVIFWEGSKTISPRPITLWLEPIITIAAMARLHLDYGWPIELLGMQSEEWAFDLCAFKPHDFKNEFIAGEIKKSSKEIDSLLANMHKSFSEGDLDNASVPQIRINAHKKCLGLQRSRAMLFWALGPDGDSRLFEVTYFSNGEIKLNRTSDDQLHFTGNVKTPQAALPTLSDCTHMLSDIYTNPSEPIRCCLREPIPEIADAARYLDAAVSAHLAGRPDLAQELIRLADMPVIREWVESLWGSNSPYVKLRVVPDAPPILPNEQRVKVRMPTMEEKLSLHKRDGYHCKFCGIPLIRKEIRERIKKIYPQALQWGSKNVDQHAAFQALWLQYDHLLPHSRGGNNDFDNIIITCAPCNYSRMSYTLEEVGLIDPRTREPIRSTWDGLERFR